MDGTLFGKPEKLFIPLDEGRFDCVGRLDDGRQFMAFGTGCFPDDYLSNSDNDDCEGWEEACGKLNVGLQKMLAPLRTQGPKLTDIEVKLFSVVLDGVTHGLFYTNHIELEEDYEGEWVLLEPRDIMFHPPWDSGEYST